MNYYQAETGRDVLMSLLRNHDELSEGLSCLAHLDNPETINRLSILLSSHQTQRAYEIFRILALSYGGDIPTLNEIRKALNTGNLTIIRSSFTNLIGSLLPQQH